MTRASFALAALLLATPLAACGDDDGPPADAGPTDGDPGPIDVGPRDSGGDAGPVSCTVPDTTCPAELPYSGGACETAETCMYPDPDGMSTWTYACTDGRWAGTNDCIVPPGGSCPVGPLAEGCRAPFSGTLSAPLELGPAGAEAFRPFTAGERVSLIVGGQGSPMVAFRVHVASDEAPACLSVQTRLTVDGGTPQPPSTRPLALHCGESLAVFEIVGGDFCSPGPFTLEIEVTAQGIGTSTASVTFDEVPCVG